MKIRADIAELLHQGFNNAEIVDRLRVDPRTVAKARAALHLPPARRRRPATALERLYAEAVPTGRVTDYQPPAGRMPISPQQAAANRAQLLAALDGWTYTPTARPARRLRAVPNAA